MSYKQAWSSPEMSCYGSVENITHQVGSVTKTGGTGDTISVTTPNGTVVVAGGASGAAAGSSLVNITPPPSN